MQLTSNKPITLIDKQTHTYILLNTIETPFKKIEITHTHTPVFSVSVQFFLATFSQKSKVRDIEDKDRYILISYIWFIIMELLIVNNKGCFRKWK